MKFQVPHAMLPLPTHDEDARQSFLLTMREQVMGPLWQGSRATYEKKLRGNFERTQGRTPKDRREVQALLDADPYYQTFSAIHRTTQEMLWDEVGDSIQRQLPKLIDTAKSTANKKTRGSLRLNPKLPMPRYIEEVDIHVMPGNFQTELTPDDVYAGALYDRGVFIYGMGRRGPYGQGMGEDAVRFLKKTYPEFKPKKILEVGCSVGHSLHPYAEGFPQAEMHGIDVGAPMLRYAHARSEALGKTIHYSQQDACAMDFADGSFDLVMSHLLLHEMPVKQIRRMYREIARVLRKGGAMFEGDTVGKRSPELIDRTMGDWYAHYNNEPFQYQAGELDFAQEARDAGLDPDTTVLNSRGTRIAFKR